MWNSPYCGLAFILAVFGAMNAATIWLFKDIPGGFLYPNPSTLYPHHVGTLLVTISINSISFVVAAIFLVLYTKLKSIK